MKNTLLYQSALVLGFLVTAYGCNKPPEYPIEPKIEFKDIESYPVFTQGAKKDSLIIVTRFEDGDGDLGLSSEEVNNPPYNQGDNNLNYLVETFVKKQGAAGFEKIDLPATSGRFFRLSPDNRVGPLEGDLRYSGIKVPAQNIFNLKAGDQIKFRVQIRDRALHPSNTVETEAHTITFP
ncbi:MAG: hypothetical protein ACO1NZ_06875 [Adhaeribacter sp.]